MSSSLPRTPSLQHLKKEAKQLLAAQRHGVARCCPLLRRLHRFSEATDEDILAARITLAEAQSVVAMHYGFRSWNELREEVRSHPPSDEYSLEAVTARAEEENPEYGGADVPLGVVAALNHAGVDMGYMELAAASGLAFSFGYRYDDISPAYVAVRGGPNRDGPPEVFSLLPRMLGFGYEMGLTKDPDDVVGDRHTQKRTENDVPRGRGTERLPRFPGRSHGKRHKEAGRPVGTGLQGV